MKIFYSTLFSLGFIAAYNFCIAQAPGIIWQHTFGGNGNDIMQDIVPTADGNYIMLGLADDNSGDVSCNLHDKHDMWVIKMDPVGNIIWQQCYGGYKEEGNPNSKIIQTTDGGYLFVTETWSSDGDVTGHHSQSDAWTVKLDANGVIQWEHSFGGKNWDVPRNLLELPGKRYMVLSRSTSSDGDVPANIDLDPESFDAWIFIVDSIGDIISNHIYGGTGDDDLYDVSRLSNGDFAFFGLTSSTDGDLTNTPADSSDGWVLVTDSTGNIVSSHIYGQHHNDSFLGMVPAIDGGFLAFGETDDFESDPDKGDFHGVVDWWAVKIDNSYNVQWQGIYGGSDKEQLRRGAKAIDNSGYFITGTTTSLDGDVTDDPNQLRDWWTIKLATDGTLNWSTALGGSAVDYAYSITETGIVVGGTYSDDGDVIGLDGPADGWVIQLDVETGIPQIENNNVVKIYPNPAAASVNIDAPLISSGSRVEVRNIFGQVKDISVYKANPSALDISQWQPGVYFLTIIDAKDGSRYFKCFEVMN